MEPVRRSLFNRIVGEPGAVWIFETKGREELDLPPKMARLAQWCLDASAASQAHGRTGPPLSLRRSRAL